MQNTPGNFGGKLRNRRFNLAARRSNLASDAFFGGCHLRRRPCTSLFNHCGPLIKDLLARGFLFGIHLRARLLQGVLVLLDLLNGGSLSHLGGFLRAHGARIALGHHRKQRLKENRPQDEVKKQDDQDCRHSLKEEFSQLANNFVH
ncbi:MAG TPA: hypothetical protein VFF95_07350 [Candidatus Binatus sp.]|nr:hypothetical protein [Candidatus Binatus sp.]